MKKLWGFLEKDLWILIFDVIAVNASYYIALLVRFYIGGVFNENFRYYLTDWAHFTPYYTVACIAVFFAFRLYGGMWKYAGLNDMNRIIFASVTTALIHILGTVLFVRRMPITYYAIGAFLQFFLVAATRFSYRFLHEEKQKIGNRKLKKENVLIVGIGDTTRKLLRELETNPGYRPVAVVGDGAGQSIDGIPVVGMQELPQALERYEVKSVFICDPMLPAADREEVKRAAGDREIVDYSGFLANLSGRVALSDLLETIKGPVTLSVDGQKTEYKTAQEAAAGLKQRYVIRRIEGTDLEIDLEEDRGDSWMAEYRETTGEEVSFF